MVQSVVKDRAVAFNVWVTILAAATAVTAFGTNITEKGALQTGLRVLAFILALVTAVVGALKFRNERAYKRQLEGERVSLDMALKAEGRRTALLINGAMLGTVQKLQHLVCLNRGAKNAEISGFRASIVSKVCDLMQSNAPRAAYFRVQDLSASPRRVMRCELYMDSRNRTDSFTSEFREGDTRDQGVWTLIDSGDAVDSNDLSIKRPATWDTGRPPVAYKSFVSVAVRAADQRAFGMLTANTLETDGFTESDIASIKVLARLLAAAEVVARS